MTYSIVARDSERGDMGVAVQSHFLAVGSVVPWAKAGVGVVATQAIAEPAYGPDGLELISSGSSLTEALNSLTAIDRGRERRQVAMVGADGSIAVHTGSACIPHAGHAVGDGVSAQANLVESSDCWNAMLGAYQSAGGDLSDRLLAALRAAEATGGDIRGRQSAAILIVRCERTGDIGTDVRLNLRVDDHPAPLDELDRLVGYSRAMGGLIRLLEMPGLLSGPFSASPDAVSQAVSDLERAQEVLGSDNPEPTVWRALLLARAGDDAASATALQAATASEPRVPELFRRLASAGMWVRPDDELESILDAITPPGST